MRPASDRFHSILRGSHGIASRVRVVAPGQTGANPVGIGDVDPDTGLAGVVKAEAGNVRLDGTADVRSTLDANLDGFGWDPRPGRDPRQPYGNELFVESGVDTGAGAVEYVPLGYFRMWEANQRRPPNGSLRVTARDRMSAIIEADVPRPRQFKKTASISGVFATLVGEVLPNAVIEFDDATAFELLGRAQIVDKSRYAFLRDLTTANGKVMYFDHRGVLVIRTPPPTETPLWDVDAGENGVLVEVSRAISREGVFNAVVAEAEAPDGDKAAVRVMAWDANPDSPTYFHGPYGQVVTFLQSQNISRAGQASSAARAMLERSIGLPYNADFTMLPNPTLEPYDPIRLKYSDTSARETHVIETLTIPLGTGAMTGTTRDRTDVLISVEEG